VEVSPYDLNRAHRAIDIGRPRCASSPDPGDSKGVLGRLCGLARLCAGSVTTPPVLAGGRRGPVAATWRVDGTHFRLGAGDARRTRPARARGRAVGPRRDGRRAGEAYLAVVLPPRSATRTSLALHAAPRRSPRLRRDDRRRRPRARPGADDRGDRDRLGRAAERSSAATARGRATSSA
jgi:hypothetical protein